MHRMASWAVRELRDCALQPFPDRLSVSTRSSAGCASAQTHCSSTATRLLSRSFRQRPALLRSGAATVQHALVPRRQGSAPGSGCKVAAAAAANAIAATSCRSPRASRADAELLLLTPARNRRVLAAEAWHRAAMEVVGAIDQASRQAQDAQGARCFPACCSGLRAMWRQVG